MVLERVKSHTTSRVSWDCLCDCGNHTIVQSGDLRAGTTKSCGCHRKKITSKRSLKHGHALNHEEITSTYYSWLNMTQRCNNPSNPAFTDYGGRGITICERWMRFEDFLEDMGERPSKDLSLDRIDNNKGYCKENCRWANAQIQARNRRNGAYLTWNNIRKIRTEWIDLWKISDKTIRYYISKGMTMEWIYINKVEPKLSPSAIQARMMLIV